MKLTERSLPYLLLLLILASCGGRSPEPVQKPDWWLVLANTPSIPQEDSLVLEDFEALAAPMIPMDEGMFARLYGSEPLDSAYLMGHRRTATGMAALVYREMRDADHWSPRVDYIALDTAGNAGVPVLIAYEDDHLFQHEVQSIFRSRYGLQQVDMRSSIWTAEDSLGRPDTLFTTVRTLQARPAGQLPDTLRVERVWRIL